MSDTETWTLDLGARPVADGVHFRVWAPRARTVAVVLNDQKTPMLRRERDYFEVTIPDVQPGAEYRYLLDEKKPRPDPASRFQPHGVHGPSAVVDPGAFRWTDETWKGLPLERLIIYEVHTGTFTRDGNFDGIIPHLSYLRDELGVTAIELMPIAQFPGRRNWGYDGVFPFAPHVSYGGPSALKRLVDACHARGLAIVLDVVYNHLGPEGNYLGDYGHYFTDRYRTPWGEAINYDGPRSDEVRHYVMSNALYWVSEYHIDALRLDAIHGIYDASARHILRELTDAVHAQAQRLGRHIAMVAESDLNDVRVITPTNEGGYGLDAQWSDDYHHTLHTLLTGERAGYYEDFGRIDQFATAWREGFVYSGQYSPHRQRRHGSSARHRPPSQFVVCAQNHDQVGNRAHGDRLSGLVPPQALKVAAMAVLLAPNLPLLFMGEEYGERTPFLYFTDHGDPALREAVREGRRAEFASFGWAAEVPDPQDPVTFERSILDIGRHREAGSAGLFAWYRTLIQIRHTFPSLATAHSTRHGTSAWPYEDRHVVVLHRWAGDGPEALLVLGFNQASVQMSISEPKGRWTRQLDGTEPRFGGDGGPLPKEINIAGTEVTLDLPPYVAALYLKAGNGR
jgi:maltooligosyltrehalose trehalohydrolase